MSRVFQDRYLSPHIYEMRISFSSSVRDMTYDYYLKHRMPMREIKQNQILAKNERLIHRLNRYSNYPFTRKYTNQEIKIANERN